MNISDITIQILKIKNEKEIVFVSICGPADTGKTTMAKQICHDLKLQNIKCDYICTDSFMIDRADRMKQGISGYNLKSLKVEELLMLVTNILEKKEIKYLPYDNKLGKNLPEYRLVKDVEILIIEGIHSFNEKIRNKIDLKIFIDSNDKVLRQLRFNANINKRGFQENEARKRINKEMEEYYCYIEPNKKYSDILINIDEKYNYY